MFTTPEFWGFVVVVLCLHNVTQGKLQNLVLLLASYILYAYFDLRFLALLLIATGLTFLISQKLSASTPQRRILFGIGLFLNIGTLAFFKIISGIASSSTSPNTPLAVSVIIPFGISFYSFRLLSYLFDVYNSRIKPASSITNFALYIAFFPQIASGPIERAGRFLPALEKTRRLSQETFSIGLAYVFIGFFYKIAIANFLATLTAPAFSSLNTLSSADALSTMIAYSVQLYADFAGYSLMAIGVSQWFGLPAMENFRRPYFSQSITEFWTRWHISLSSWFRDYLFYPLSRYLLKRFGNQHAFAVQCVSYLITMFITGLWHGVNWTFVIWGILFGSYMVIERAIAKYTTETESTSRITKGFNQAGNVLMTFLAVSVAWIFFRMPTVNDALDFFQRLFQPFALPNPGWWWVAAMPILLMLIGDLLLMYIPVEHLWKLKLHWRVVIAAGLISLIIILGGKPLATFVYFQF